MIFLLAVGRDLKGGGSRPQGGGYHEALACAIPTTGTDSALLCGYNMNPWASDGPNNEYAYSNNLYSIGARCIV
jgi:hypothetical protein